MSEQFRKYNEMRARAAQTRARQRSPRRGSGSRLTSSERAAARELNRRRRQTTGRTYSSARGPDVPF